jgi:hypothetical protein
MFTIDKTVMTEIMRQNRATLGLVPRWISDADYLGSIFHYGLPAHVRPFIDGYIGDETTYSDVIAYFANLLTAPVRYLEIGVSVGKNFLQLLHYLRNAELVGFDIEDINPTLERFLEKRGQVEWETQPDSLRKRPSRFTEYAFPRNNNRARYLAGDVFDAQSWERLKGEKFNLVFSDAYHSGEALIAEWEKIKALDLLEPREFTMIWDDLHGPEMQGAFERIAREMQARYGVLPEDCGGGLCRGWLGPQEGHHTVGIVRKRVS